MPLPPGWPVAPHGSRRWPGAEAVDDVVRDTASHGGLGALCSWEQRREHMYRVVPLASVLRVCAVAPHVPYTATGPSQRLCGYEGVDWWWVCPYQRDRAGPARGLDWQRGIAIEARQRPKPVLEVQCMWCGDLVGTADNPLYTCDHEPGPCLSGYHKLCLAEIRAPVPRGNQAFYCPLHAPLHR